MDIAICDTDSPCDEMTAMSKFTDIDYSTFEESIDEDAIHNVAREWCFSQPVEKSHNYKIPDIVTEENLSELCERFRIGRL